MRSKNLFKKAIFLTTFLTLLLIFSNFIFATVSDDGQKPEEQIPQYVPGEVLVKFKDGVDPQAVLQEVNLEFNTIERSHSIKPAIAKFKKDLKLEKDKDGWYWFRGKQYKEGEDIQDEELFREAYLQMSPAEKSLYRSYKITLPEGVNVEEAVTKLQNNPNIEYAEPNYIVKVQMVPNDPYYHSKGSWGQWGDDLWGLKQIKCEEAWDISQGEGIIVAVVDTGVDYNHEDIAENIWINVDEVPDNGIDDDGNGFADDVKGWDFLGSSYWDPQQDNDPMDGYGHGTHVAGTIAAVGNNNKGIIGVSPKAKVMALKGLDDRGYGTILPLANALRYAADNDAKVINNSWSGPGTSYAIKDAVDYAYAKGCVIIASAGNESNPASYYYPANLPNVITVAASLYYSNYGEKVDVIAPGEEILSLLASDSFLSEYYSKYYTDRIIGDKYLWLSGTSMASPHVAGVAALILAKNPFFTPEQIRYLLRNNTDSLYTPPDRYIWYGRINAYKALSFCQEPPDLYANITSPSVAFASPENIYTKGVVKIKGSAGGTDFGCYELEYAKYLDSDMHPIASGISKVNDGILGEFDTSTLENGKYVIKLTVKDAFSDAYTESRIPLYVDNTLKAGWPKIVSYWKSMPRGFRSLAPRQSLTFADLDNDGYKEVITIESNRIYAWKYDGSLFHSNFPIILPGIQKIFSTPAISDLDSDGNMEIIVTAETTLKPVYAFHNDGTLVDGFPAGNPFENIPPYPVRLDSPGFSPVVTDLEGDGEKDIIVTFGTYQDNYRRTFLLALDNKGVIKEGWPVVLSSEEYKPLTPISTADLDKDGKKEILVGNREGNKGYLNVYSYNGEIKNKIGFQGETSIPCDYSPILIGDVNNDKNLEIFIKTYDRSIGYLFYLLNSEGKVMLSWPQKNSPCIFVDLDGDADLEIFGVGGGNFGRTMYAYHHDGSIVNGFPKDIILQPWYNTFSLSPMVTGYVNKSPEAATFLSAGRKNLYGFDNTGEVLDNWPKHIPPTDSACAVGDLDKDGIIEIGVHSLDGMVYIWQEAAPQGKEKPSPWSTIFGNNRRTNCYNALPTAHIDSITPNPVRQGEDVTLIGHGEDEDGEIVEYSWRSSINGYLGDNSPLVISTLSIGEHTIFFKVKDDNDVWSEDVSRTLTVLMASPTPPSDLTTFIASWSRVDLKWQDNSDNEDGFKIKRTGSDGSITEFNVDTDTTTYIDNTVNRYITYTYKVIAHNEGGDSEPSNEVSVNINADRPSIASITPYIGAPNIEIEIRGQAFGIKDSNSKVLFHGIQGTTACKYAQILTWQNNYIKCVVPSLPRGIYGVKIMTSKARGDSGRYNLKPPYIYYDIWSYYIAPGVRLPINGRYFGRQNSRSKVFIYINNTWQDVVIASWNDTKVEFVTPALPTRGTYPIRVQTAAGKSNTRYLHY